MSKRTPNNLPASEPQSDARRPFRVRRAGAALTALVLTAGIVTAGLVSKSGSRSGKEQNPSALIAKDHKALVGELTTAYVGPLALTSAVNTGEVRTDIDASGGKRAVVRVNISGTEVNEKTAKSTGNPTYGYGDEPIENVTIPNGSTSLSGAIRWVDASKGEAEIYPRLDNFAGRTPSTWKYNIGVTAGGVLANGQEIDVVYNVGEADITGANGKISSIKVVSPPDGGATPNIIETGNKPLSSYLHPFGEPFGEPR